MRTRYPVLGLMVYFVLLAAMPACNTQSRRADQQQALVMNAISELRQQFNQGSCQAISINIDTSDDALRKEWFAGCERLRNDLSWWNTFADYKATSLAPVGNTGTVMVEGLAMFGDSEHDQVYWLETYWHILGGRPRLYLLRLAGGDKQISLPHPLPSVLRLNQ